MNEKIKQNSHAHQAFRHGGLVHGGEMLFEGQYDAVGNDGSEDQVLKWSGRVKEKHRNNNTNNNHKFKKHSGRLCKNGA